LTLVLVLIATSLDERLINAVGRLEIPPDTLARYAKEKLVSLITSINKSVPPKRASSRA